MSSRYNPPPRKSLTDVISANCFSRREFEHELDLHLLRFETSGFASVIVPMHYNAYASIIIASSDKAAKINHEVHRSEVTLKLFH